MPTSEPVVLERSDLEPLPETRVAVDNLLEFGFEPQAHFPSVELSVAKVGPYEMVDGDGRPSLFGLDRPAYERWAGDSTINTDGVFRLEHLERGMRAWRNQLYPDCPLCGCEDFHGQWLVPRHNPHAMPFDYSPFFSVLGDPRADESAAGALAAAINATPPRMTIHLGNGATLIVDEHNFNLGDVVTINGQRFRVGDIIRDPTAARAAASPPRVELFAMTGAQMAERTAKQHLESARPRRRLDGRRAG